MQRGCSRKSSFHLVPLRLGPRDLALGSRTSVFGVEEQARPQHAERVNTLQRDTEKNGSVARSETRSSQAPDIELLEVEARSQL
jgi:hypothetical protein